VRFDVIIACQVEALDHALNVSLRKKRANVGLKARQFRHWHLTLSGHSSCGFAFVFMYVAQLPCGMKPGTPVFTTVFNLCLVATNQPFAKILRNEE
jgi:hypothetical protein